MKDHKEKKTKSEPSKPIHDPQPDAAGVDIGANEIWAAVPAERSEQTVRKFAAFTRDLKELVKWFLDCGIRSVAMEATGVYWIPLFQLLEDNGLKVCLVNARHVKNAPGRKSDVRDCQWLQYLHSVGLLVGSFRPAQAICATRSIYRFRQNLLTTAGQFVQHAHAALDQMGIKLHHVIDDITGVTGQAIIGAILSGQRDPVQLAKLLAINASRLLNRPSSKPWKAIGVKSTSLCCKRLGINTNRCRSRSRIVTKSCWNTPVSCKQLPRLSNRLKWCA